MYYTKPKRYWNRCAKCKHIWKAPTAFDNNCKCYNKSSVAQGHTRDDPAYYTNEFPWDYELPSLPDDEHDIEGNQKKICDHFWYITGYSPITNDPYENCKYCDMMREDYGED